MSASPTARPRSTCGRLDYDGKGGAWVRLDDGTDAVIGGSRVEW